MNALPGSVSVYGYNGEVLSSTHPARARMLVDSGRALVIGTEPFSIKLVKDSREVKMVPQNRTTPAIMNFTEYFREERDVYVQNRSNTQVSLQFEVSPGRTESMLIPKDKRPLNLTQYVPFKAIKESVDLRKMVNRTPPVLVLLKEEEFLDYYKNLADQRKVAVEDTISEAQQYQRDLQDRKIFTEPSSDRKTLQEMAESRKDEPADPQDKVSARVVGLCGQAAEDIPEKDRVSASSFLEELKDLDAGTPLTRGDLEYLQGHAVYKGVKTWAAKIHSERWS